MECKLMSIVAPHGAAGQAVPTSAIVSTDHTNSPEDGAREASPELSPAGPETAIGNAAPPNLPVVEPGPDDFELLHWPPGDDSGPGLRMEIRRGGQLVYPQDGAQTAVADWVQFRDEASRATRLPVRTIERMMDQATVEAVLRQGPGLSVPSRPPRPEAQPGSEPSAGMRMAKTGNPCRDPRELDEQFQQWLDGLEPGWGPTQLGRHLESFLRLLCGHYETVTEAELLLETAADGLQERGYKKYTKKRLWSLFKEKNRRQMQLVKAQTERQSGGTLDTQARYYARSDGPLAVGETTPRYGILDRQADGKEIANFEVVIKEELQVEDDLAPETVFVGTFCSADRGAVPWRIPATTYANNTELQAALYNVGGAGITLDCHLGALRNAIAEISPADRRHRRVTTNFGWNEERTAYLVPGGRITGAGFEPLGPEAELSVDLTNAIQQGGCLGLTPLEPGELQRVKRHLVADWLASHDRRVTYSLLGTAAAAVLYPFVRGLGRYALWLTGLTGTGKSFSARLAQHFFGVFPDSENAIQTWSSTPNHIQMTGYYFRHALYLVDDYKPNAVSVGQQAGILKILQAYGDNTARGRLGADLSFQDTRPVRGFLVSTGEDIPEHSASTVARSILIDVPKDGKDLQRGRRCLGECRHYGAVTADFIRWLLAEGRAAEFGDQVRELQDRYYADIQGQQNDLRIAGNFALLAAGFRLFAEYLGDVWPEWHEEAERFLEDDLVAVRNRMLGEVRGQQESDIFLSTLRHLIAWERVRIDGYTEAPRSAEPRDPIGKRDHIFSDDILVSIPLALAAVQRCLRDQGRPELRLTPPTLIRQLREDGLVSPDATRNVRLDGTQAKCVRMEWGVLMQDVEEAPGEVNAAPPNG
jgi:hypothetical protein